MNDLTNDPEFRALLDLSSQLGSNPLRTQAAGGNVSLKRDGVLWIKASGAWLSEAAKGAIMVPVALGPLQTALAGNDERSETASDFVLHERCPSGLHPSIETSVHAVINLPVVVHIHCVATIALAVRQDAEVAIAERLDGMREISWIFVPYVRPGRPLSRAIASRLGQATNVVIMGNHGLIVAGESVAKVAALVERVSTALDTPMRAVPAPDLGMMRRLAAASAYRLPNDPVAHGVATDAASLTTAQRGSLYPDHVVFLGRGIARLKGNERLLDGIRDRSSAMLVLPSKGVLIHRGAARGSDELARCLAEVAGRIPPNAPIRYLTITEERDLMGWDAEIYRHQVGGAQELQRPSGN